MKLEWNGAKACKAIRAGGEDGVSDAADLVLEASQRVVPVETGDLKASGRVIRNGLTATVQYGAGLPDNRAAIVHEKTELHHNDGQPKFLENPAKASGPKVLEAIANGIRRKLR